MAASRTMVKITIGGTLDDDAAAFLDTFERAERGEVTEPQHVLSFETWATYHRNQAKPPRWVCARCEPPDAAG